jgi:hypothetical protein
MISIIICSVRPHMLARVKDNIAETIGIPHEIIAIDNSTHQYSICRAYNEGAAKARFSMLCFMHEDISFETPNWGALVCKHLSDHTTGLIGVAGGDCKSIVPSSWSIPLVSNEINLVQHYRQEPIPPARILTTNKTSEGIRKKVVMLDGVWLCTRKDVFDNFQFDEQSLTGFHGYDIDYSLQVHTRYNVFVVFDILIHHFSEGTPNKEWFKSAVLVSKKWRKSLPLSNYSVSRADYTWHHWHTLFVLMQHLFRLQFGYAVIIKNFLRYSFTPYFSFRRFLSVGKYVLLTMVKR